MPSSAVLSSGTERSRCGGSIQVIVFGYGVTMVRGAPTRIILIFQAHGGSNGAWAFLDGLFWGCSRAPSPN
jgi:hypothetical protein